MKKNVGAQGARKATERVLTEAVLRILDRDGLLSGFTLSAVGTEANVDRALVYQYFGNRRELLRAALREASKDRLGAPTASVGRTDESLRLRWGGSLRRGIANRTAVRLATILHCDVDSGIRMIPDVEDQLRTFNDLRQLGYIRDGVSAEGFIASMAAMVFGYSLFRERFAEELDFDATELDAQVDYTFNRLIDLVASPQGNGQLRSESLFSQ